MTNEEQIIELFDALDEDQIKAIALSVKPLQQHIDRRVTGAIAKAKETPDEPTLDDREKLLERKETVLSSAIERGLDPKAAMALLGIGSEATDDERLDLIVEYTQTTEQAAKDQILKDHVRNPRTSQLSTETPDEHILAHPESYPSDIVNDALDRGIAKESEKRTLRQVMGGGR